MGLATAADRGGAAAGRALTRGGHSAVSLVGSPTVGRSLWRLGLAAAAVLFLWNVWASPIWAPNAAAGRLARGVDPLVLPVATPAQDGAVEEVRLALSGRVTPVPAASPSGAGTGVTDTEERGNPRGQMSAALASEVLGGSAATLGAGSGSATRRANPTPIPPDAADSQAETPHPFPTDELSPAMQVLVAPESDPDPEGSPGAGAVQAPEGQPEPVARPAYVGATWPTFTPGPAEAQDHYWLERPFGVDAGNHLATPQYQFGSDAGGRYRIHHGIDISNPLGTPVFAVASGEVIFAGSDAAELLGPYLNFYGNSVVIRLDRRYPGPEGDRDVFVLYGHLNEVLILPGQRAEVGQLVGRVGMTGIAIGPHLHLEVRVGKNDYASNVNPLLWITPPPGAGTVAVRLLNDAGQSWENAKISVIRVDAQGSRWLRTIQTYQSEDAIQPDPAWGENGAMGDLPAGLYILAGDVNGERVEATVAVSAGATTFVALRTQQ